MLKWKGEVMLCFFVELVRLNFKKWFYYKEKFSLSFEYYKLDDHGEYGANYCHL